MRKSVRFAIVGGLLVVVAFIANVAAREFTGGAFTTEGSVLLWVSLLGWLAGAVLLIVAIFHALRAVWRWSSSKPAAPEQP